MPDLIQSLQGCDLSHLRIVAELWGLEWSAMDVRSALHSLSAGLLDRALVEENVEILPAEARAALSDLIVHDGRLPWTMFTRRYGGVREMGPGKRDRERPYLNPASPAEILWYRALVARAFFDSPSGPEEFAYVPDDLLALLPVSESGAPTPLGRPARPAEKSTLRIADDSILDHACTLLAALRTGLSEETLQAFASFWTEPYRVFLHSLLSAAGFLDEAGLPQPEPARVFLEAPRGEALLQLVQAYLQSPSLNELRMLPGLIVEGEWQNDPLRTRQVILRFLSTVPANTWWSLTAFVSDMRRSYPDFQRPAGDYDSWYIRQEQSGEYLRGFENWNAVDGALIRFTLCGPLHWLGILDLAFPESNGPSLEVEMASAFRTSMWAADLLAGKVPQGLLEEDGLLRVSSDARLLVPKLAPRRVRYQVARFCLWEGESAGVYQYRLTPASLEQARLQSLQVSQLISLLRRYTSALPPSLVKALERWEQYGSQARLERVTILRLGSPDLLQALRNSKAARFLGDPLGPTVIEVNSGAWKKVLAILAEMGYLGEADLENKSPE
jgi:hypothetical protein